MAMTATSMAAKINAARAGLPQSNGSGQQAATQADAMLLALCQGIIDEIHQNAQVQVTGVQAGASNANGTVL